MLRVLRKQNFDQASRCQLLNKSLPFEFFFCTDPVQCSEAGDNEEMERLTLYSTGRTVISIYFKAAECGDEVELYII